MLSLPPAVRIFVSREPVDMRKGFDSLAQLVRSHLAGDPLSGHLFVFRSKRGDRLKVLYWDSDGLCLFYKRLELGTFTLPTVGTSVGEHGLEIRAGDFALLLEGIDLTNAKRHKRYRRPAAAPA
jgi:transposase